MADKDDTLEKLAGQEYQYGFVTPSRRSGSPKASTKRSSDSSPRKKNEPRWLLDWRLKAYKHWLTMKEPTWATSSTRRSTTRTPTTTRLPS